MKIYLAASFSLKDEVRKLYCLLERHGHTITKDWTHHKNTRPKEDPEDVQLAERYAVEDLKG